MCVFWSAVLLSQSDTPTSDLLEQCLSSIEHSAVECLELNLDRVTSSTRHIVEDHEASLMRILLVVKLVQILAAARQHTDGSQHAQLVLWHMLDHMLDSYFTQHKQSYSTLKKLVVTLITELLVAVARQLIMARLDSDNTANFTMSLVCLKHMLSGQQDTMLQAAVGAAMIKHGIWPVVVGALNLNSQIARQASAVLSLCLYKALPFSQVPQAEALLDRMQAPHRLCNLFCPEFTKEEQEDPVLQAPRIYGKTWEQFSGYDVQLSKLAACLILKLQRPALDSYLSPESTSQRLATPSPALWAATQTAAAKALLALHWHKRHPEASLTGKRDLELEKQLMKVAWSFLYGHIQDPALDSQLSLKLCCRAMVCDEDLLNKCDSICVALHNGVLTQLRTDPKHLQLPPAGTLADVAHLNVKCAGCNACCGPEWQWKTETVAAILQHACQCMGQQGFVNTAGLLLNALYAALEDPQHCQHILRGTQTWPVLYSLSSKTTAFLDAYLLLSNDEFCLTTQLTALACLARLCNLELANKANADWKAKGGASWYSLALAKQIFPTGMAAIAEAFAKPAPWSTERTVALTRALHRCSQLHSCVSALDFSLHKQVAGQLVQSFVTMLSSTADMTVHERLRLQLLEAALGFLAPALEDHTLEADTQRLPLLLVDLFSILPTATKPLPLDESLDYPSFGLPETTGSMWCLRAAWLAPTVKFSQQNDEAAHALAKHVQAVGRWFTQLAAKGLVQGSRNDNIMDPRPYLDLLVWFRLPAEDKSISIFHRQSIKAMLQCLSNIVGTLVDVHQHLRNLVGKARSLALANGTSKSRRWTKPVNPLTDNKIASCRAYLVKVLCTLEAWERSFGHSWPLLLSQPTVKDTWTATSELLQRTLTQDRAILHGQAMWVEILLESTEVQEELPGENSQVTAIEQLLLEEQALSTKAGSKRATKQLHRAERQRALLQQQQQEQHHQQSCNSQQQQQQQDSQPQQQDRQKQQNHQQQQPQQQLRDEQTKVSPNLQQPALGATAESVGTDDTCQAETGSKVRDAIASAKPVDASPPAVVESQLTDADAEVHQQPDLNDSTSSSNDDFLEDLFCCPLIKGLMGEPVIAADGHSYEKAAMTAWLAQHNTSPVTGKALQHMRIVDNLLIRHAISQHKAIQHRESMHQPSHAQKKLLYDESWGDCHIAKHLTHSNLAMT